MLLQINLQSRVAVSVVGGRSPAKDSVLLPRSAFPQLDVRCAGSQFLEAPEDAASWARRSLHRSRGA